MTAYLDERYLDWLYGQVCSVKTKNPSRSYRNLLHVLYTTEFVWMIPNDDNRIADGKYLRYQFVEEEKVAEDQHWMALDCSWLELLIGISRRLNFLTDRPVDEWFHELLANLGLDKLNDRAHISIDDVQQALKHVTFRMYDYNGHGGLFPLKHAETDQAEVEIWYQLNAYIIERGY